MSGKTYVDSNGNQVTTSKDHFTIFERIEPNMIIPCLDHRKAHYYEKNKFIVNGCWYYAEEKIVFIGFDNVMRIFSPQWKLEIGK